MAPHQITWKLVLAAAALPLLLASVPRLAANVYAQDFASTRFSPLDEVDADNVGNLVLDFAVPLPRANGYVGTPQKVGGTLVVMTPFPHRLYGIDVTGGQAGSSVKWTYAPKADRAAAGLAGAPGANYGPTAWGTEIYLNTLDGHTVALAAETGQVVWDVRTADIGIGETLATAPLVTAAAVIVGNAGDDFGARGWIEALDRTTGRTLWRQYSTGPDDAVGIGPSFRPFYDSDRGKDLGVSTWPSPAWQHGGGSVFGMLAYDPALNLVFHGTGRAAPRNPDQRSGDNKWTGGLFARDPSTGAARWFVQLDPHDLYGFGATAANVLVDLPWRGTVRPLLLHPDANGYVYVLDRRTGAVLSAESFVPSTVAEGVDISSGKLRRVSAKQVRGAVTTRDVCPAAPGASTGASGFAPPLGLLFIPTSFLCMDVRPHDVSFVPGTPFAGVAERLTPMAERPRGAVLAWDVAAASTAWTRPERFPVDGSVLATAGNLVFYGTLDGWFRALDAHTGRVLWQYRAPSQIAGQPISYRGPDGHQYVAVMAGTGGPAGMSAGVDIDTRDATAARGFANALPDLPQPQTSGGALLVFRLTR
jgi:PQQ-dependent dehydrogenase (methanol/ethanol family)